MLYVFDDFFVMKVTVLPSTIIFIFICEINENNISKKTTAATPIDILGFPDDTIQAMTRTAATPKR